MPDPIAQSPVVDLDRLSDVSATLPVPDELGYNAISRDAALFPKFLRTEQRLLQKPMGAVLSAGFGGDPHMTADDANQEYGVEGYLRFNKPVMPEDAAALSDAAHERFYRDQILSRTQLNPLRAFGAGLQGSIVDPIGAPLMLLGGELVGGLKGAAAGGEAAAVAADSAGVMARLGRVGNLAWGAPRLAAEGVLANTPYVAVDYALRNAEGDDYGAGDVLRDLAAGAIFHTTLHYGGKGVRAALDAFGGRYRTGTASPLEADPSEPHAAPTTDFTPEVPEAIQQLAPVERMGAFVKAIDDAIEDRPVDIGRFVERRGGEDLRPLDEASAEPRIPIRPLDEGSAVTPRGTEVTVRYGLVELGDLVTSHDNDLARNPGFPEALQPRDRERAGAIARNHQLEAELNPKLLMRDASAAAGAPVVGPDGVVESGNGRTIALRRSAQTGSPAYARYIEHLKAEGLPVDGMRQPVLVRMRTQPMAGADRAGLAREMNADVVERMSATEQAMADAKGLDDATMAQLNGGELTAAANRPFARAFLARVAPDAQNSLVAPDGALSAEGVRRVKAAVVAKAYGDPRLVESLFEAADPSIRAIGQALSDAAPGWAAMRAAADRGEIPPDVDLTANLRSAVDLVRHARDEGRPVGETILERLGQTEMFSNEDAISPETETFLRLFYRDDRFQRPRAGAKVAEALKDYARQAQEIKPGPDLFGDVADASTARQILANLAERYARDAQPDGDLADLADGRAQAAGGQEPAPRAAVVDVPQGGAGGDGGGPGLREDGGGRPGERGGEPGSVQDAQGQVTEGPLQALVRADPELKALSEATDRLAAAHGIEPPALKPADDPETLAKAMDALASCAVDAAEELLL